MKLLRIFFAVILFTVSLCTTAQSPGERFPKGDADTLFRASLGKDGMSDLNTAFGMLWLNQDLPEANRRLRAAYATILDDAPAMTPEIADENAKWQMRTWVRIYYLFSGKSAWYPGRLEPETEGLLEELLWHFAYAKSTVARAALEHVWVIQGSENHDAMDLVNAFLAAQALVDNPAYQDRPLSDGASLAAHVDAWTAYYTRYAEERVKYGLLIEVASPIYGKYMIPELVNISDFAADPALRSKMTTLLDVIWADWTMDQLNGVRGGGKTRCYQGKYSRNAAKDSYTMMGSLLLRGDGWEKLGHGHPIHGFNYILATSRYALPKLVGDLALAREARGAYAYVSRRPGRMTAPETLPPLGGHPCWYVMKAEDSRLLRYSWVTPDYVMGSFGVDPGLNTLFQVEGGAKEHTEASYAAISAQNRWQGVVFSSAPNARVFPQCEGKRQKPDDELTTTYAQHVTVQHENVLIVQANRAAENLNAMRVYFSGSMKERLVTGQGWYFLEEGGAYLAVKALSREDGMQGCKTTWEDDFFLRTEDLYAPVIFVAGRKTAFNHLYQFMAHVQQQLHRMKDGVLRYDFRDAQGTPTQLTLYANEQRLPEINGQPINLAPTQVYDSPYMQSDFGSGKVTLRFQDERLLLDVTVPE